MRNEKGQFVKGHEEGVRFGSGQSRGDKSKYIKIGLAQKGKFVSPTTREKMSEARLGKMAWNKGLKGTASPNSGSFTGGQMCGEKNVNWAGGISKANDVIRGSIEERAWIRAVFARDHYTCQITKVKGCRLTAHHILNFASHPELRFTVENGISLSEDVHVAFHSKYGKRNNTPKQLAEFADTYDGFVIGKNA